MGHYRERIKTSDAAAKDYNVRKRSKHAGEVRLLERALGTISGVASILDAPCGTGRFVILLAEKGFEPTGIDLGDGALKQARINCETAGMAHPNLIKGDLERLELPANSFDAVLCFRLFHHLPDTSVRDRVVSELCRVSRRYVLISYFDPASYTSIKRAIRARLFGKPSRQHATALTEVSGYFAAHGYHLQQNFARIPFIHTINLAVFIKTLGNGNPA